MQICCTVNTLRHFLSPLPPAEPFSRPTNRPTDSQVIKIRIFWSVYIKSGSQQISDISVSLVSLLAMAESFQNTSSLTITIDELLGQGVEKQRVETFKKAWKGSKQGKEAGTYWQVLHTICAFANNFSNNNGGYIIIGVEEEDEDSGQKRQIKLPPCGIPGAELDRIQKEIMGACQTHIQPNISPILSPEIFREQNVLVIWTLPTDNGPHQCRETEKGPSHYYIRKDSETKKASVEEVNELYSNAHFDNRMAKDKGKSSISSILGVLSCKVHQR